MECVPDANTPCEVSSILSLAIGACFARARAIALSWRQLLECSHAHFFPVALDRNNECAACADCGPPSLVSVGIVFLQPLMDRMGMVLLSCEVSARGDDALRCYRARS